MKVGVIVWVVVKDRNGIRKRRPVIVLTAAEVGGEDGPLVVVAVTTTFPHPPPGDHVALPWNADARKVGTGLARRSAAVCSWLDVVYPDEIDEIIGRVPVKIMAEIARRVDKI